MKRFLSFAILFLATGCMAASLGTSARAIIPSDVQQIISVDYRTLESSSTAMALKDRVLPDNLKQFETALRGIGLNPDSDIDQLAFVSFREKGGAVRVFGIAEGQFDTKKIMQRFTARKVKPTKYRFSDLYPASSGLQMAFLDPSTMIFGETSALKDALDTRDGESPSMNSNSQVGDMMNGVERGTVWSVLDAIGTQNMMRTALGDAAKLGDYETVKKRLLGSRYTMNFSGGVNFDLDVFTPDSFSAGTLSALVKAGMLYKKMGATGVEKIALESMAVESDGSRLRMQFKTDDNRFQSLLHSELFAAVSK